MIAASSVIAGLVSLLTDGVSGFMIAALRAIAECFVCAFAVMLAGKEVRTCSLR